MIGKTLCANHVVPVEIKQNHGGVPCFGKRRGENSAFSIIAYKRVFEEYFIYLLSIWIFVDKGIAHGRLEVRFKKEFPNRRFS